MNDWKCSEFNQNVSGAETYDFAMKTRKTSVLYLK